MERAYSYIIIVPPAELPVSLEEVKRHLRLDEAPDPEVDAELTLLINAATEFGQAYTKLTFVNTTYRTYRDFFECCIKLRRAPFVSLEQFQYLVDGVFIDIDQSIIYTTHDSGFSKIILKTNQSYPSNKDDQQQESILIDFIAGFGTAADVPDALKLALLNHIAALYENRGDCDQDLCKTCLPNAAKCIYSAYQIIDLYGQCI